MSRANHARRDLIRFLKGPECNLPGLARSVELELNPTPKRMKQFENAARGCLHKAPSGQQRMRPLVHLQASQYKRLVTKLNHNARGNSLFHAILHAKHIVEMHFPFTNKAALDRWTQKLRINVIEIVGKSKKIQGEVKGMSKHGRMLKKYQSQFYVENAISTPQISWQLYGLKMQKAPETSEKGMSAWGDLPEAHAAAHYLKCEVHVYRPISNGFSLMEAYVPERGPKNRPILRIVRVGAAGEIPVYHALWHAILANYQTGPSRAKAEFFSLSTGGAGGISSINSPNNMIRTLGNTLTNRQRGPMNDLIQSNNYNFSFSGLGGRGNRPLNNGRQRNSNTIRATSGSGRSGSGRSGSGRSGRGRSGSGSGIE